MPGVIPHPRQALDHNGDAWQGPKFGRKPVRPCPAAQRAIDALALRRVELGRTARAPGRAQRIDSALLPLRVPAAGALTTDPQDACHLRHDLARGEQLGSAPSSLLQSLEVSSPTTRQPHDDMLHDEMTDVTLFYEAQ